MTGNGGNDTLAIIGPIKAHLFGGEGDDTLRGASSNDLLEGGPGMISCSASKGLMSSSGTAEMTCSRVATAKIR